MELTLSDRYPRLEHNVKRLRVAFQFCIGNVHFWLIFMHHLQNLKYPGRSIFLFLAGLKRTKEKQPQHRSERIKDEQERTGAPFNRTNAPELMKPLSSGFHIIEGGEFSDTHRPAKSDTRVSEKE